MVARGRFPRSKEELGKDMLKYPLAGAFMVGTTINYLIDGYNELSVPVTTGPQAGYKALKAIKEGDWEKGLRYGIQSVATMSGVPYNQLYRTWKGTLALMNNETDDWRRLIWSEYALEKGLPKYSPRTRTKRKGRK